MSFSVLFINILILWFIKSVEHQFEFLSWFYHDVDLVPFSIGGLHCERNHWVSYWIQKVADTSSVMVDCENTCHTELKPKQAYNY